MINFETLNDSIRIEKNIDSLAIYNTKPIVIPASDDIDFDSGLNVQCSEDDEFVTILGYSVGHDIIVESVCSNKSNPLFYKPMIYNYSTKDITIEANSIIAIAYFKESQQIQPEDIIYIDDDVKVVSLNEDKNVQTISETYDNKKVVTVTITN